MNLNDEQYLIVK